MSKDGVRRGGQLQRLGRHGAEAAWGLRGWSRARVLSLGSQGASPISPVPVEERLAQTLGAGLMEPLQAALALQHFQVPPEREHRTGDLQTLPRPEWPQTLLTTYFCFLQHSLHPILSPSFPRIPPPTPSFIPSPPLFHPCPSFTHSPGPPQ